MKAAVYYGKGDIRCVDIPRPEIGPRDVLVRVHACGLCQSDIKKILSSSLAPPRVFGHETAGTIAEVGAEVSGWAVGDRVAVMHHIPCFRCRFCLEENYSLCQVYKGITTTAGFEPSGGGFADFVRVPPHIVRNGLVRIPAEIGFDEATFIEPVNCCLKAIRRAGVIAGERVLVIGAGPIGLLFVELIAYHGAIPVVYELKDYRRQKAIEVGAISAIDPRCRGSREEMVGATGGRGADVVFICVAGEEPARAALDAVRPGGRVLFFAEDPGDREFAIKPNWLYRNEVVLLGSYSSSYKLQQLASEIVLERRINVGTLISDEVPLAGLADAIERAVQARGKTLKIIIRPGEEGAS